MMTVNQLADILSAEKLNLSNGERQITCGYAGDLLSFVMGRAPSDCAWFTVMTNVNICAVSVLADVSCIVVCEGSVLMDGVLERARQQNINILSTKLDVFSAIKKVCHESQI